MVDVRRFSASGRKETSGGPSKKKKKFRAARRNVACIACKGALRKGPRGAEDEKMGSAPGAAAPELFKSLFMTRREGGLLLETASQHAYF